MHYVIFGAGRVGVNMAAYLQTLGHNTNLVTRRMSEENGKRCAELIASADIVAAAIPDSLLKPWRSQWKSEIGTRPAIHFSGAVNVAGMFGFHPLYSFPKSVLDPSIPATIAFACPEDGPAFSEIFPGAKNPTFVLPDDALAHYHALAVLSGNFAAHLWNVAAKEFADRYDAAPETIMTSYFNSIVERFRENPTDSLTGPAARRDAVSVEANLKALAESPELTALYHAFLQSAWPGYGEEGP